jgi:ketosteroid isomerase-like protein
MGSLADFQRLYQAFNSRDVDGVLALLSPDVDWPNAWRGGRVVGRDAVRDYWSAQWADIAPHVEPLAIAERSDGRLAVTVRQIVRSFDGQVLNDAQVVHVYRVDDGLIQRMDVEEPT